MSDGLGAGPDEVTATFRAAPGGQNGSGSGTNEAGRVYGMGEDAAASINNDDDADHVSDDEDDGVPGDDDLIELWPVGRVMGLCCPCLEHRTKSVMSASLVSGTGNLALYEDAAKTTGFGGTVREGQPVYVEGTGASAYPWADRLLWRWTDANSDIHYLTNRFTVLSVRLFGDLDFDGDVDAADKAMHPALSREHGWAMPAATNVFRPVRLRTDVGLQGGAYTLSLAGESGAFRVWRDASGTNAVPLLVCGQTVTNGVGGVSFLAGEDSDLYVEAVSNGTATLTYAYAGTGDAAGIFCAASLKMTGIVIESVDLGAVSINGLVVTNGGSVLMTANIFPNAYIPPTGEPKWYYQQLNGDVSWGDWTLFGNNAYGVTYRHFATENGIFGIKAVLTIMNDRRKVCLGRLDAEDLLLFSAR